MYTIHPLVSRCECLQRHTKHTQLQCQYTAQYGYGCGCDPTPGKSLFIDRMPGQCSDKAAIKCHVPHITAECEQPSIRKKQALDEHHTHKWYLLRIIFQPYFSYWISCHCRRASIHRTCHSRSDQRICHVHKNSPRRLRFFCTYFTIALKNHKPRGGVCQPDTVIPLLFNHASFQ